MEVKKQKKNTNLQQFHFDFSFIIYFILASIEDTNHKMDDIYICTTYIPLLISLFLERMSTSNNNQTWEKTTETLLWTRKGNQFGGDCKYLNIPTKMKPLGN